MGCCDPKLRDMVIEKEKEVNEKGRETIPLAVKLVLSAVLVASIILVIALSS